MGDRVCRDFIEKCCGPGVTNASRIEYMLKNPKISSKINEWIDRDTKEESKILFRKDSSKAKASKDIGNNYFKEQDTFNSLSAYNHALINAKIPDSIVTSYQDSAEKNYADSEEYTYFSIILANRSMILLKLGRLKEALSDCELALSYNYPNNLRHKLFIRRAEILIKLNKFELAKQQISQINLSDGSTKYFHDKVKEMNEEMVKKCKISTAAEEKESSSNLNNESTFQGNPKFINASQGIEIKYLEDKGRHVICTTNLDKGKEIFSEKPFASVLLPDFYHTHCFYCHQQLDDYSIFPCRNCTQVLYCSEACSKISWAEYHQYECMYLNFLNSTGIGHLALRIIMTAKPKEILNSFQRDKDLCDLKNISLFDRSSGGSNYERVYSLMDHISQINPEDLFQYTLTATLLTKFLLDKTSYFKDYSRDLSESSSEIKIIGGVMLKHICQLICNAHAITSILTDFNAENVSFSTAEESQKTIATGVFTSISLLNHCCEPNITNCFINGRHLFVKLTTDLKIGNEIFNSYGVQYRRKNYLNRQEILKEQYFFICVCQFCTIEEKTKVSFCQKFESFRCTSCNGSVSHSNIYDSSTSLPSLNAKCSNCGLLQNLKEKIKISLQSDKLYKQGEQKIAERNIEEAISIFTECFNIRKEILHDLNQDLALNCDTLSRCYAYLGEFKKSLDFAKESLRYVEERFGEFSIEYTRELSKYCDLFGRATDKDNDQYKMLYQKVKYLSKIFFKCSADT